MLAKLVPFTRPYGAQMSFLDVVRCVWMLKRGGHLSRSTLRSRGASSSWNSHQLPSTDRLYKLTSFSAFRNGVSGGSPGPGGASFPPGIGGVIQTPAILSRENPNYYCWKHHLWRTSTSTKKKSNQPTNIPTRNTKRLPTTRTRSLEYEISTPLFCLWGSFKILVKEIL